MMLSQLPVGVLSVADVGTRPSKSYTQCVRACACACVRACAPRASRRRHRQVYEAVRAVGLLGDGAAPVATVDLSAFVAPEICTLVGAGGKAAM
jgi:hypothetical protein